MKQKKINSRPKAFFMFISVAVKKVPLQTLVLGYHNKNKNHLALLISAQIRKIILFVCLVSQNLYEEIKLKTEKKTCTAPNMSPRVVSLNQNDKLTDYQASSKETPVAQLKDECCPPFN